MKRPLGFLVLLFALCGISPQAFSQCGTPTGATINTSFAVCAGQGGVKVTNVIVPAGSGTTNSFQYALYDSGNANLVKPFQSLDTFAQVSAGFYRVRVRRLCAGGTSNEYISSKFNVAGSATSLSNVSATPTLRPTTCSNGILATGPATGGGGGYKYALVPSVNAAEPVANYVRTPRTANGSSFSANPALANFTYFDGLPAGTYFIRSYDTCGSFTTRNVTLTALTEPSTNIAATRVERSRCDSVDVYLKPYSFSQRFSNTTAFIDTFSKVISRGYTYTFTYGNFPGSMGTSINIVFPADKIKANTDTLIRLPILPLRKPGTDTIFYRLSFTNDCGTTVSQNFAPSVKDTIRLNTPTYTQSACRITTALGASYTGYVNKVGPITTRYSFDGGATWATTTSRSFLPGQTYTVGVANSCGDTTYRQITTPAYSFPVVVANSPSLACPGKGGITFRVGAANAAPANMDSIVVISQPGTSLPAKFVATASKIGVDTGVYTFSFKDTCGNTQQSSVTVTALQLVIQLTDSGVGGFCNSYGARKLVLTTRSNFNDFNASFRNTTTNVITLFRHNPTATPSGGIFTQIAQYDLPLGNYTVKVWSRGNTADSTCARTANFINFTGSSAPSYSLSQSLFTSGCADATATVVARAIGGGGGNRFSLYLNNTQLQAPSVNNTFNNLVASSVYEVRATDTCGNGTQYSTSFSNAPVPVYASQNTQPCNGDTLTLSTASYQNAVYSWMKNGQQVQQSTLNTYGYRVAATPPFNIDTFRVSATYGSCSVPAGAKIIVNPAKCNEPLPVLLQMVRGKFLAGGNAQLSWSVGSPDDFTAFSIQYSTTGTDFKTVETVPASTKFEYSFVDNLRSDLTQYYRIKALTKESDAVFSPIVTLRKGGKTATGSEFSLVANRISSALLVNFTMATGGTANWQILSLNGQTVLSGNAAIAAGSGQFSVSGLDPLPAGLYLIRIFGENYMPFAGKFEHL